MRSTGTGACSFVLVMGLLVGGDLDAGSLEPPGPPAPTMKTLDQVESRIPISSLPVTIAAPGSYYLTRDLSGTSGQPGITIAASFVSIDLNGFALIGVPGSTDGILNTVVGTEHLVIRNGAVRNWGARGIAAPIATEVHAENLRIDGNGSDGLQVGNRSVVRGITSSGNGGNGMAVGSSSTVSGCTAGNNSGTGIAILANSMVSSSTSASNGAFGFALNAPSVAIDCVAHQNINVGFNLGNGSRVARSLARQNTTGFFGGDGVSVEECTAEANTDDGIRVSNRGFLRGNVVRGNTNDGIQAPGSQNRIEENQSHGNGVGIRVDAANNLIVKNSVGGNGMDFQIVGGNQLGPISTDPATANTWANFDQ